MKNFVVFQLDESGEIHEIYWRTEQKCQKYTKMIVYYVVHHQSMLIVSFMHSIYSVLIGNFDISTFFLPFHISIPFTVNTIWKWYLLWFIQFNMALSYALTMVSVTSYFVCCCLYIAAICDHFDLLNYSFAEEIDLVKNVHKIRTTLIRAIQLHVNLFE